MLIALVIGALPIPPVKAAPANVFRGISVPGSEAALRYKPYNDTDYARFQSWNMNTVGYVFWWGTIERNESQPYVYDETRLTKIGDQIALARARGLYPFVSMRIAYGQTHESWMGWSDLLGADYVNLNTTDSSGTYGRARFCALLKMVAHRFPNVGIIPWHFPYHAVGTDDMRDTTYYNITFPAMLAAIRQVSTVPVVFMPMHQGVKQGITTGEYDRSIFPKPSITSPYGDSNLYFGLNGHDGDNYSDVYEDGKPWDGDVTSLRQYYQPALNYKNTYGVKLFSPELGSLLIHTNLTNARPIDATRLAWLEEHLRILNKLGASWHYWRYENPSKIESPIEINGSVTQVIVLLNKYGCTAGLGDVNGDGRVDASDLLYLSLAYGSAPLQPSWNPDCDFNLDGVVNVLDLFNLGGEYGRTNS